MKSSLILVVDIGNTSTHVALERDGKFMLARRLASDARNAGAIRRLAGYYAVRSGIDGAILCSVVPRLDPIWIGALKKNINGKLLRVNHKMNLGIGLDYPEPSTIGADRLANAAAAVEKYGAPVIVADFGTALTFDIVTAARAYAGGIIAPGPALFTQYLAEKTALLPGLSLPLVRRAIAATRKQAAIGKGTRQAMLIGMRLGYIGMVREIISRLKKEKGLKNARLCATGGYAGIVLSGSGLGFSIDPLLTLRGISRIYRLNA
jgi:type III pantothenate kinase